MAKPSGANVTITKHGMADSVFRHAYGGVGPKKAEPAIALPSMPSEPAGRVAPKPLRKR